MQCASREACCARTLSSIYIHDLVGGRLGRMFDDLLREQAQADHAVLARVEGDGDARVEAVGNQVLRSRVETVEYKQSNHSKHKYTSKGSPGLQLRTVDVAQELGSMRVIPIGA